MYKSPERIEAIDGQLYRLRIFLGDGKAYDAMVAEDSRLPRREGSITYEYLGSMGVQSASPEVQKPNVTPVNMHGVRALEHA